MNSCNKSLSANFLERFINIKVSEMSPPRLDLNSNSNLINDIPQSDPVSTQYTKLTTGQEPSKKIINLNFQRKVLKLKPKAAKSIQNMKTNLAMSSIPKPQMHSIAGNKTCNLSKNTLIRKKVYSSVSYSSV